jgi:ABC-type nitrate/sulfonate/bicarbonate transport system permease component
LLQRLFRVMLPAASPQIMAGMRTSLSLGVTVIFFSELVGSTDGIGHRMLEYQRSFAIPEMWSGILLMGLLGYLLNVGFRGIETLVLRWHRGMHRGPGA